TRTRSRISANSLKQSRSAATFSAYRPSSGDSAVRRAFCDASMALGIEFSMHRCYNSGPFRAPPFAAFVLKLIASKPSPYARKVRIALAEKKIEYQLVESSGGEPGNPLHAWNPLGKLPVLILDDGTHLYYSRVIAEYIALVRPVSRLIPEPARQRIAVKKWEALADGVCDATSLIVNERRRSAQLRSRHWHARE